MIFLKNNSGADGTWAGAFIASNVYKLIETGQEIKFSTSDDVINSISSGGLIAATSNDGNGDLAPAQGLSALLGTAPIMISPFPEASDYFFRGQGGAFTLNPGNNIADMLISSPRLIQAAEIIIPDTAGYGISVDFQVVDKDNVIGYGANVVLNQFGWAWQLHPKEKTVASPGYLAEVPALVYIRCIFNNLPAEDTDIYINLHLHEHA